MREWYGERKNGIMQLFSMLPSESCRHKATLMSGPYMFHLSPTFCDKASMTPKSSKQNVLFCLINVRLFLFLK